MAVISGPGSCRSAGAAAGRQAFGSGKPDVGSFLRAARLNPSAGFPLVNRVMPDDAPEGRELRPTEVRCKGYGDVDLPERRHWRAEPD